MVSLKEELRKLYESYVHKLQERVSSARELVLQSNSLLNRITETIEHGSRRNDEEKQRLENVRVKAEKERNSIEETFEKYCDMFRSYTFKEGVLSEKYLDAICFLDKKLAAYYERKPHPAMEAANTIKDYRHKNRELRSKLAEYESYLSEFLAVEEECKPEEFEQYDDDERIRFFIPEAEYYKLSDAERNQLALDRYLSRNHSKGWIGRMYERYIGYRYEIMGYSVYYRGIDLGLKDGGIDLECTKGDDILLVQCKCWAKEKVIYEKHILQLYGSSEFYKKTHDWQHTLFSNVVPVFVTTVELDETAINVAKRLGVKIVYAEGGEKIKSYPMVKCNINPGSKEKIYHLPFDQMYDKTQIKYKGECYTKTVAEAELLGFRHAKKWAE